MMTLREAHKKKFWSFGLSLGLFLIPLSLFSCSSRQIYFTNPPESATTFFDKNFSNDLVLQNRLIDNQSTKLKADLELMGAAFSKIPHLLEEAFKNLDASFKTLATPIGEFKREINQFLNSFWQDSKLSFSPNTDEALKRVERVFELTQALKSPKTTQSRESLIEELKAQVSSTKIQLQGRLNELFLNLRPIERAWNSLVEEHSFTKKDGSLEQLPIQKVFFQNIFDNVSLENLELLFHQLFLWTLVNPLTFFNYPALSRDDFFEVFRKVAPLALESLPKVKSFGLFLKILIVLKATYILTLYQSLLSLEAILALSQKSSLSNVDKLQKAFKDLEKTFQQRKFFTNINTSFIEVKNNFDHFESQSVDFQNHISSLTKSLALLDQEIGDYFVNLPPNFDKEITFEETNVLDYTLERARDISISKIPQVVEGFRTLTLNEFFTFFEKNLKKVSKFLSSPNQRGLLANHISELEKKMEWFFALNFSNLKEGVLLLEEFRASEPKVKEIFETSANDFLGFERSLWNLLYNLLLFNIVLQKLNFVDKNLKHLEETLNFLKDFFEKTLLNTLVSYFKDIRGIPLDIGQLKDIDKASEASKTQKLIQQIRDAQQSSTIFHWIQNFRGSYLGASSTLEYLFARLYESI